MSAFGAPVNQWTASYSPPWQNSIPQPSMLPLSIPLTGNQLGQGNWLMAIVSWRQDSGFAGSLTYPSTISVSDDYHNWWLPAKISQPNAGIVRSSIWIAPAARGTAGGSGVTNTSPTTVYVSPTGYTSAITVLIIEWPAVVPWYNIELSAMAFTNQGTTVTASLPSVGTGPLSFAVLAWDTNSGSMAATATNWTGLTSGTVNNGFNQFGTMNQFAWYGLSPAQSITGTLTGATADLSALIVTIGGITDQIAMPYSQLVSSWPILITEMGLGSYGATFPDQVQWTDLSARNNGVAPTTWARGAQFQLNSLQAGTFSCSLDNIDGFLNPQNASSPYYSNALNANPLFASGTSPWTVPSGSGTFVQSQAWASGSNLFSGLFTPDGVTAGAGVQSEKFPVKNNQPCTVQALVFSPQGWSVSANGVSAHIFWFDGGGSSTGTTNGNIIPIPALGFAGTLVSVTAMPPTASTAQAQIFIKTEGTPAASTLFYISPAALVQGYNPFVQAQIDTDVPIRFRAIWPFSPTPYSVLFDGYTDDLGLQQDQNLRSWLGVAGVDVYSRLTAQLPSAGRAEVLVEPGLQAFFPMSDPAGSTVAANYAPLLNGKMAVVPSVEGAGSQTTAFGSTAIALPGDPGANSFAWAGMTTGDQSGGKGQTLIYTPASQTNFTGPWTFEMFASITGPFTSNLPPSGSFVVATCFNGQGPVWTLAWNQASGTTIQLQLTDTAGTAHNIGSAFTVGANFTGVSPGQYTVSWNSGNWVVNFNPWNFVQGSGLVGLFSGTGTFSNFFDAFSINGSAIIGSGNGNGWNGNAYHISYYAGQAKAPGRSFTYGDILHTAKDAINFAVSADTDAQRLARITGYAGFPAVLGENRVTSDNITAIADTLGQVASAYYTNIVSSTQGLLMIDGPGNVLYRDRNQWYNNYTAAQQPVPLNATPYFRTPVGPQTAQPSLGGWAAFTNCAVATSTLYPYAGNPGSMAMTVNGGATPLAVSETFPILPNTSYSAIGSVTLPGAATGTSYQIGVDWFQPNGTFISSFLGTAVAVAGNSRTFILSPAAYISPSNAGLAAIFVQINGTPTNGTVFYWGSALLYANTNVQGWTLGEHDFDGEVPVLKAEILTQDRSRMYNFAYLSQFGTTTAAPLNTGTLVQTKNTSGITVTANQVTSQNNRGQVPYNTSSYLTNTVYNPAVYQQALVGIEDVANFVVNSLSNPTLRAEQVPMTPMASARKSVNAVPFACQAEVGDNITFNRRPLGQVISILPSYISQIRHSVNYSQLTWDSQITVSPNFMNETIACDAWVTGLLNGVNVIGV